MASLPSDDQVRARAEELGLLDAGAALSHDVRKRTLKIMLEEAQKPAATAQTEAVLLSRQQYPHPDGTLRVDVILIPNPKKETPNG